LKTESNLMDQNKIISKLRDYFESDVKFGGTKLKISNLKDQNENNLKL
jgi:hypothetical protein